LLIAALRAGGGQKKAGRTREGIDEVVKDQDDLVGRCKGIGCWVLGVGGMRLPE
jgi:hypothetical protein